MSELPSGAATFLYTDLVGWTQLLREIRDRAGDLIDEYEGLLRTAFTEGGGHVVEVSGDTFVVVFARAAQALAAAAEGQRRMAAHKWPHGGELLVRIGINSGEATALRGRYFGLAVNRTASICSLAHGGQVLVSNTTAELAEDDLPQDLALRDLGEHRVQGFERPARLFQLAGEGLRADFPPIGPAKGLPTGTVTFLFTDIEGSTELTRRLGADWPEVHAQHRRLLRAAFAEAGGSEVDSQGDAFFVVFTRARQAIEAASSGQRLLHEREWPGEVRVPVRMGIHTGEPAVGEEGYLGLDVVRAARICAAARGGQVLVSETTRALVRGDDLGGVELRDLGEVQLKDLDEPDRLFELAIPGLQTAGALDLRPGRSEPVPALRVASRGLELASEAVAAARDLGRVEGVGEAVEQAVAAQLRAAGLVPSQKQPGIDPVARDPEQVEGVGEVIQQAIAAAQARAAGVEPPQRRRREIDWVRIAVAAAILVTALMPVLWALTR